MRETKVQLTSTDVLLRGNSQLLIDGNDVTDAVKDLAINVGADQATTVTVTLYVDLLDLDIVAGLHIIPAQDNPDA